jgi:hypothetical protein
VPALAASRVVPSAAVGHKLSSRAHESSSKDAELLPRASQPQQPPQSRRFPILRRAAYSGLARPPSHAARFRARLPPAGASFEKGRTAIAGLPPQLPLSRYRSGEIGRHPRPTFEIHHFDREHLASGSRGRTVRALGTWQGRLGLVNSSSHSHCAATLRLSAPKTFRHVASPVRLAWP